MTDKQTEALKAKHTKELTKLSLSIYKETSKEIKELEKTQVKLKGALVKINDIAVQALLKSPGFPESKLAGKALDKISKVTAPFLPNDLLVD